jgi:hypothetical protein
VIHNSKTTALCWCELVAVLVAHFCFLQKHYRRFSVSDFKAAIPAFKAIAMPAAKRARCKEPPQQLHALPFTVGQPCANELAKVTPEPDAQQQALKALLVQAGLAASCITGATRAVSVQVAITGPDPQSIELLLLRCMLGLAVQQEDLEHAYQAVRDSHISGLFAQHLQLSALGQHAAVAAACEAINAAPHASSSAQLASLVDALIATAVAVAGAQQHALRATLQRISWDSATLAGAALQCFLHSTGVSLDAITLRPSPDRSRTRLVLLLHDPESRSPPPPLTYTPALPLVLAHARGTAEALDNSASTTDSSSADCAATAAVSAIAERVLAAFWQCAWQQHGYLASPSLQVPVSAELRRYIVGGLSRADKNLQLCPASFAPSCSLALYLHGVAGCGKSAFVRALPGCLAHALGLWVDPELQVHFVKQVTRLSLYMHF